MPKTVNNYKVTIEVLGVETSNTGKTALNALKKFKVTWEDIKCRGVLKAEKGDKTFEKLMNTVQLRRIFMNDIAKQTWANNIELLLS